ncbi:hypothetical protein PAP_00440 [Palaeococcus pacificus DY20341]|uniref:Protein-glutamine gamma-glutamyltransferase-like C-terminal domain-containing protein n=1 Tax=Palaeococcus pacificus DY20341 TaxID=1343739 RepID=A0A075LPA8_9EURY|nr:DUF4129 domain-containing protein [Palaeococcus pacificus]AIF68535.1 hypothetical protein PAP_00440 [Palaeococcus pacificus DY20341]
MGTKAVLYFIALIILMSALTSHTVGYGEEGVHRDFSTISTTAFLITVILAAIFLVLLFLIMRDPFQQKPKEDRSAWLTLLAYAVVFGFGLVIFLIGRPKLRPIQNATALNGTSSFSGSYIPNKAVNYSPLVKRAFMSDSLVSLITLFLLFGTIIVFSGIMIVRLHKAMRIKRMKRELENFDRKIEEEGIKFIGKPEDIVVELYKKAVLWLEVLGVPYKASWTHWEHYSFVKHKREAFKNLTSLFEKAKYAPERVTMKDAETAYNLYRIIRGENVEV